MAKNLTHQPNSPNGVFQANVESLKDILGDPVATTKDIVDGFAKVLDLLECIPVEQPVYAAAKAALVLGFKAVCKELLDGNTGMDVRGGVIYDLTLQAKKVLRYAWL